MPDKFQGYLYLTAAMITVGSTVIASKVIASGVPPFTATALRFAMALPVFIAIMAVTGRRLPRLSRRDWLLIVFQAIAGSVGYTTLLISGLSLTSAANAGIIIGTLPVVTAVIAMLLLGERPSPGVLLTIVAAAAGVLVIVFQSGGEASLTGDVLIFGAVLCEGLFILINKRLDTPVEPLTLSTLVTAFGLAGSAMPALMETHPSGAAIAPALWAIAYYAMVPTVAGFIFWYAGARRVTGAEASVFTSVAPVSAVIMAAVFLGETLTFNHFTGMICVLAAVLGLGLIEFRSRRRTA